MKVTTEMALAMANWWGDHVRTNTNHDNGDRSMAGLLTSILANRLNEEVTDEARKKFVDILTDKILKKVEEKGWISSFDLDCDYGPSKFLSDAAKEAGIDSNNFPWKTNMAIREEDDGSVKVMVSCGYGAPWTQIWPEVK